MAIEHALTKLVTYGQQSGYFISLPIGSIDKSCCKYLEEIVIDFDKTKEFHGKKFGFDTLQSCDGLKIIPAKQHIAFVEMKSISMYLRWQAPANKSDIESAIGGYDLKGKIRDSLVILSNIINHKDSTLSGNEKKHLHSTPKHYIFLVDVSLEDNPLEYIAFTLGYLGQLSSDIVNILEKATESIGMDNLNSLQRPMLMNCSTFKAYYDNI